MPIITLNYELSNRKKLEDTMGNFLQQFQDTTVTEETVEMLYDHSEICLGFTSTQQALSTYNKLLTWYETSNTYDQLIITNIKLYYSKDGNKASWFHSVNLYLDYNDKNLLKMINTSNTKHKLSIDKNIDFNPLIIENELETQYGNEGELPQTWSNNIHANADGYYGTGNILRIIDISNINRLPGEISIVKLLGGVSLITGNEREDYMIAVNCADPQATVYHDISNIDRNVLNSIIHNPIHDRKIQVDDAFYIHHQEAAAIVQKAHHEWFHLLNFKNELLEDAQGEFKTLIQNISISNEECPYVKQLKLVVKPL